MADYTFNFPDDAGLSLSVPDELIGQLRVSGSATLAPFVYVCDSGNSRIQVFDYDGNFLFTFGSDGTGDGEFRSPYGVATDGTTVFVSDSENHRIQYFDLNGNYLGQWGTFGTEGGQFNRPKGIAVDNRFVYVVDQGNDRFQIFSKDGASMVFMLGETGSGDNQFSAPTNCYVDSVYLWIDDTGNNRIVRYEINFALALTYSDSNLPSFEISAAGGCYSAMSEGLTLGALTLSASSSNNVVISANLILPGFTLDAFTAGRMLADIAGLTADAAGHADLLGEAFATLPGLAVSGEISVRPFVTSAAELPGLRILATGFGGSVGSASLELPGLTALIRGYGGQLSQMSAELPPMSVSGVILADVTGQAIATLPAWRMVAFGHYTVDESFVVYPDLGAITMNTVNKAVTNYDRYPFNSMAYFNGDLLLAGPSGLFLSSGDKDVAADIDAHIRTARMDFFAGYGDTPNIMRKVREGILVGRADGNMLLTILDDEDISYVHDIVIDIGNKTIVDTRVKFARGMKGRHYDFKLENQNGSDFEIVSFRVKAEGFPGRRR